MSWARMKLAVAAATASAMACISTAALAGVVVSSSGPSAAQYPVGSQIARNATITLRDGDVLTVLENGGTRVFRGPGSHTLASASTASSNQAFASLTTQRAAARARTGAVRSAGAGEVRNPSLWYVDVTKPGTVCLPSADNVRFWRANTQAESIYALTGAGASGSLTFRAGEMLSRWDSAVPLQQGAAYRIGHSGNTGPVDVTFVFLDRVPDEPEALAQELVARGCLVQLRQLADAMMAPGTN